MDRYKISISNKALKEIQETVSYYENFSIGLGKRFSLEVKQSVKVLQKNPFFQIRYDEIRCLPLRKFPCMIHFFVDIENKFVEIFGVINTSQNPEEKWVDF